MNGGDKATPGPDDRAPVWMLYVTLAVFSAVGLALWALIYFSGAPKPAWRLCDDAIKATLIAPSTYKRIDGPGTFAIGDDNRSFAIEYDAENSFGVPIRGKGFCTISADRSSAKWVRMPPFD